MVKRIMYIGNPGDQGSPYEFHGAKFIPRTVQPVSDELYEAVRHIHKFVTVEQVNKSCWGWISGQVMSLKGVDIEKENLMVQ